MPVNSFGASGVTTYFLSSLPSDDRTKAVLGFVWVEAEVPVTTCAKSLFIIFIARGIF